MNVISKWLKGVALVLSAHTMISCMESVEKNDGFTIWCDDHACAWEVDQGKVEQVPTWHRKAYGISFMSDPTRISQVVDVSEVGRLKMALLGDADKGTALYWEIDFDNDDIDHPDYSIDITDRDWKTVQRQADVPEGCQEVRIIFHKQGPGRVVVFKADLSGDF